MEGTASRTQLDGLEPALIAGALLLPVGLWARHAGVGPGSVPLLNSSGRAFWVLGLLSVAATAAAGYRWGWRSSAAEGPYRAELEDARFPTAWILPAVISLTGVLLLQVYHSVLSILLVAAGAAGVLVLAATLRAGLLPGHEAGRERGLYTLLLHVVAFLALSMIYINKVRSLFSASAVFLLVTLILLVLLDGEPAPFARRLVYALCGGVILGQITWVLNYWRATGWTGGAALLIFFYLLAGLILSELRGRVTRRDVAEYGVVSLVAFGIVTAALLH